MQQNNQTNLAGVLQIVLIVLKLTGLITWSWWWVLAPTWIGLLIVMITVLVLTLLDK